jgi:hypothetical protein
MNAGKVYVKNRSILFFKTSDKIKNTSQKRRNLPAFLQVSQSATAMTFIEAIYI